MKKRWWWTAPLAIAAIYGLLEWTIDDWRRDLVENSAATSLSAKDADFKPIAATSFTAAENAVRAATDSAAGWKFVGDDEQVSSRILHFTHTAPYLNVVDDVTVTITPNGGSKVLIHALSESRSPFGDFGRSPRNLRRLLNDIRANLDRRTEQQGKVERDFSPPTRENSQAGAG